MPDFEVRPARPEDREAVLAFCQQTWEWGDYLEYVWDEWLNNPQGKLFVATIDGQPVGVANIRMLNKTEAWFEGMRIDPTFRQQGIASALFNAQLAEAKHAWSYHYQAHYRINQHCRHSSSGKKRYESRRVLRDVSGRSSRYTYEKFLCS